MRSVQSLRREHQRRQKAPAQFGRHPALPLPKDWKTLVDLSQITNKKLNARILNMLTPQKDMWSGDLGKIRATEHNINLKPNTIPLHQHPYRAGPESHKVLEDHINLQLAADVIEPAQSEWDSPVQLAPKKDGTLWFCVEFGRLNALTIPDTCPLPRMEDCIDSLGEARLFTTLDAMELLACANCRARSG